MQIYESIFQIRPALPKYTHIWDVNVVLTYLKTFAEATLLTIKDLTMKLNILLFLTIEYTITIQEKLKQTRPGKHLKPLEFLDFPEEPKLIVTLHLQEYLKRTNLYPIVVKLCQAI